jgi:hypothetical protein
MLAKYCESRGLFLEYKTKGSQAVNGQDIWTESITVGGRRPRMVLVRVDREPKPLLFLLW